MSERKGNFHEFSIKSVLFKGRSDWYFCYLKSERIAQVLNIFSEKFQNPPATSLVIDAAKLPQSILYFVAGDIQLSLLLAEILSLISTLRVVGASHHIPEEHIAIIIAEYEALAEKIGGGAHPSPFVSSDDFSVPMTFVDEKTGGGNDLLLGDSAEFPKGQAIGHIKDVNKGQELLQRRASKSQEERARKILEYVRNNDGVSVKEIAHVIRNCSEKTIQRELAYLIKGGMVKKLGERRWSVYRPVWPAKG